MQAVVNFGSNVQRCTSIVRAGDAKHYALQKMFRKLEKIYPDMIREFKQASSRSNKTEFLEELAAQMGEEFDFQESVAVSEKQECSLKLGEFSAIAHGTKHEVVRKETYL